MTREPGTETEPVQVIAVTSGKGGVGKTSVAVNLAATLGNRGQRVMLLDADLGLADVNVALGLTPRFDLSHVIHGERRLDEILLTGPSGVVVVPAASGEHDMAELTPGQSAGVIAAFSELSQPLDVLIVDTAAGLAGGSLRFVEAASEVLVVLDQTPTSIANAHRLIQALRRQAGHLRYRVLVNRVAEEHHAARVYEELAREIDRDMDVALHYVGCVPEDYAVGRALMRREPVVNAFSGAPAARAFKRLARRTETWAPPPHAGGLAFFVERAIARDTHLNRPTVTC